ncbi:MAG: HEAT repeat domain-containing protein [Candidatus Wallbacteria bacterium]|nr:HEAT repeat domain-containing protein [Candidatus Wallbacteria bacterium]
MAINLKKICRDVAHQDEDIQLMALTTIGQLSPTSIEDPNDLVTLRAAVQGATGSANSDIAFLAKKAANKIEELFARMPQGRQAAASAPDPSEPPKAECMASRTDVLASLAVEEEPVGLATLLSQLARVAQPVDVEMAVGHLGHTDARVRANAVEVVEKLGDDKRVTELLTPLLADDNNRVRGNVAKALGRIGVPKIALYLEEMLKSNRVSMRESAVYAMSHIRAAAMVDLLVRALRDPYEGIRLRAVRGLKMHNDERAVPAIRPLLNDLDIDVCEEARKAIRVIRKDQPATMAGEMYDIEQMAERDAQKRAAAAFATPPRDPSAIDGSIGLTAGVSKKQQAELLQKQAESLLARKPAAPALTLEGRGRGELEEMLKAELKRIGLSVFKRVRASELTHPQLNLLYYDILKYQETLKRHQEKIKADGSGVEKGFFGSLKAKLAGGPAQDDPVTRLERRIDESYIQLGRRAVEQVRAGGIELPPEEGVERVTALEEKIAETPATP